MNISVGTKSCCIYSNGLTRGRCNW